MREYRHYKNRFSWLSPFLLVLSLVCDVAVVWTIYLLVKHEVGLALGTIIIVAALLVSLWAKSPWRRQKIRPRAAITVFVITAVIMTTVVTLAGAKTLVNAKNIIVSWAQGAGSEIGESFAGRPKKPQAPLIPTCEWAKDYPSETYRTVDLSGPQTLTLKTIQKIEGTDSNQIQFTVDCIPCVINYGYEIVGEGAHKMFVSVYKADQSNTQIPNWGIDWVVIEEKGDYTIKVDTAGVKWWLKIGVQ